MAGTHRVEITRSAEEDVLRIRDYIARDSPEAAARWCAALERRARSLARFPLRCPVIPEAADLGREYRHLIVGNYRVVFRVEGRTVWILRVIHGAQLLDLSLIEEGPPG